MFIFAFPPDVIWREARTPGVIIRDANRSNIITHNIMLFVVNRRATSTIVFLFVFSTVASTRVRVSFFESEKPCVLPSPPKSLEIFGDSTMTTSSPILQRSNGHVQTQISSDGWDNPFRPDGDLSKEADQIVELIKEGKPITPTPTSATSPLLPDHSTDGKHDQQPVTSTPTKANGTCNEKNAVPPNVEVQRGTVINGNEPSQVEHVVLKKKPKCRCCVIQ
ncbi:unnamed protein product [Aphis gossypii]|uniref:Uncharacterized protein n=1 Tax=Aphis gossypii TaxID=80765 RepID=A0A9P0N865_APHGO|nr:unnamed protein product [Aphis gossypii]